MDKGHVAHATTTIDASPSEVWDALVSPEKIEKYMFGAKVASEWKKGSPISWRGEWKGKPYEDKGTIVTIDPPRELVHTHWSSFSELPDSEENYQTVTWTLSEKNGGTELVVSESNLPSEQMKSMSESSWQTVLEQLKKLLESA
jgi:uncharacterized protein YndB with AHSA1/START domain